MGRLIFTPADVKRVAEHSLAAPTQQPMVVDYDADLKAITKPVAAPSVILVHDDGVYLMSNGEPRDIVEGTRSFVAHAKGCDPKKDGPETSYDNSRDLVGGDDFGECLPWARELKFQIDSGAKEIVIDVRPDGIELIGRSRPAPSKPE